MIKVKVLSESDDNFQAALIGMGLSYNKTVDAINDGLDIFFHQDGCPTSNELCNKMLKVAKKNAFKGGGHNKFLRAIHLDLIVQAPIDFWEQMATYTTVDAFQSSSTMHSLKSKGLENGLDVKVDPLIAERYRELLTQTKDLDVLKKSLPCGYLYIRTIHLNYMTLQNIYKQRRYHKLPEWQMFCEQVIRQVKHPYFIDEGYTDNE